MTVQVNHPVVNKARYSYYNKKYIQEYVDGFDKNQYVIEWSHPDEYDYISFKKSLGHCQEMLFSFVLQRTQANDFDDTDLDGLAAYDYKYMVSCMLKQGYEFVDSWKHAPDSIFIKLSKSYEAYGELLSVSGVVEVSVGNSTFPVIKPHINECYALIVDKRSFSQGSAGPMIYVDISPAIDTFRKCMADYGYAAKSLK